MKKILTSCLIVLICLTAFITGYGKGCYSYAVNQDGTLTNDELDIAVSSWLQSHGGNLFSPQNYRARKTYEAGLIHNFIYGDGGGYDAVRNHINGGVGGNNELKFDFDGFIIQKLNTWLNRKLQDGEFGEGAELNEDGMFDDSVENQLYNGEFFTTDDGNTCLVYSANLSGSSSLKMGGDISDLTIGTKLKYSGDDIINTINVGDIFNISVTINGVLYQGNNVDGNGLSVNKFHKPNMLNAVADYVLSASFDSYSYVQYSKLNNIYGEFCIFHTLANDRYYLGFIGLNNGNSGYINGHGRYYIYGYPISTSNDNKENVVINFITNTNNNVAVFPTINEGDTLYITPKVNVGVDGQVNYQPYIVNEGDNISNVINQYYIDSNTPDKTISYPTTDPNDTGGGNDNPSGGTLPNWDNPYPNLSPDGEGGFNFNFNLPDLNIDWNISGLKDKFPFSIPFDLIHFVEVLNATPETPEFDWTIDLKIYQWHIDADLHQFDNLAGIVRNVEFIGFCITLIMITRRMIKG